MDGNQWITGYLDALLDSTAAAPSPTASTGSAALAVEGARAAGAGGRLGDGGGSSSGGAAGLADLKAQNSVATRYFVNEITAFSEEMLHRTWTKATAVRDDEGERGARLENLCWRIWYLTRRRRQVKLELASRKELRERERRQVERDVLSDLGITDDDAAHDDADDSAAAAVPAATSAAAGAAATAAIAGAAVVEGGKGSLRDSGLHKLQQVMEEEEKEEEVEEAVSEGGKGRVKEGKADNGGEVRRKRPQRRLYIVMISMHGLVRGENMELGRDSDTGGQVKYVVEYARALATHPFVYRVDLLTRQITAPGIDWSYGEPSEMLICDGTGATSSGDDHASGDGGSGRTGGAGVGIAAGESAGAYIVRIPCGPPNTYLRKEMLWPFVPEFVDGALAHISNMARVLADQVGNGRCVWPYIIHGHYADAGDAAALLSGALNVPMVMTGHSLGRNKLEQLLKQGHMSVQEIDTHYRIVRRIEGEESALDAAELVVTSTRQEVDDQWGLYDGFDVKLERVLRARERKGISNLGRYMPRMAVIPPGMDFRHVVVPRIAEEGDDDVDAMDQPPIWSEIRRFFSNPHKPMILALARPDPKKNLTTLVRAYGESKHLQQIANLTLIMGNRDDIDGMPSGNAEVLVTVLKLIDKYDLYGLVAYPKHHTQTDVKDIYALAAKSKGLFVNPALVEPFGLTLIEAAAHGLPMVATKNGGPVDIEKTLHNGALVDPHDKDALAAALLALLSDRAVWSECRRNALANIHKYAWPQHCVQLLNHVAHCRMRHPKWRAAALFDALSADVAAASTDAGTGGSAGGGVRAPPGKALHHLDSIGNLRDLSLRLSIDGTMWGGGSFNVDVAAATASMLHLQQSIRRHVPRSHTMLQPSVVPDGTAAEHALASGSGDGTLAGGGVPGAAAGAATAAAGSAAPALLPSQQGMRMRSLRRLLVVAVDEYDAAGRPGDGAAAVLRELVAAREEQQRQQPWVVGLGAAGWGGSGGVSGLDVGIAVATALPAWECVLYLRASGVPLRHISVVIAGSGSAVYYSVPVPSEEGAVAVAAGALHANASKAVSGTPSSPRSVAAASAASAALTLEDGEGWQLVADPDYFAHVEYRWSADGVRRSVPRAVAAAVGSPVKAEEAALAGGGGAPALATPGAVGVGVGGGGSGGASVGAMVEDELHSTSRCLAYRVLLPSKMPGVEALRKQLRMRGLRCSVVYCRSASSLYVLPLHASRAQALRYLFVRWGIDVAHMAVFLAASATADSDAPQLLSGTHRTILLRDPASAIASAATAAGSSGGAELAAGAGSVMDGHCLALLDCAKAMEEAPTALPNIVVMDHATTADAAADTPAITAGTTAAGVEAPEGAQQDLYSTALKGLGSSWR